MNENYKNIEIKLNEGKPEEALVAISELLKNNPSDIDGLLLRAKTYYRLQQWGNALNDLNQILNYDAENIAAINYKSMVMSIIGFWNKDSFNP